jgi:hypothetical protein
MITALLRHGWWWFLLVVVGIKSGMLLLDPIPKFFFGDSGWFIVIALTDIIPEDRAFAYGYVIRFATRLTHTLTPLLVLQTAASAACTILLVVALRTYFHVAPPLAFAAGILCALEPLQLLYERYVMAESVSLFVFALYLLTIWWYLDYPHLVKLVLVHGLGVAVISLRFSFLAVVLVNALCLPLLVSGTLARTAAPLRPAWRWHGPPGPRVRLARLLLLHLGVSLGVTFAGHQAYKQTYAALSGQPPGYHSTDGFQLAAAWAPVIRPEDFPLPALRPRIFDHLAYDLQDRGARSNHLFHDDGLISMIRQVLPTLTDANRAAKATAFHALQRNPLGVVRLAWETALDYFRTDTIHATIQNDLAMDESQRAAYQEHQQWAGQYYPLPFQGAQPMTLTKHYYAAALPWYWLLLLTPLLCVVGVLGTQERVRRMLTAVLLVASVCVVTTTGLTVIPAVRYLHPVAWLVFFPLAVLCQTVLPRQRGQGTAGPRLSTRPREGEDGKPI